MRREADSELLVMWFLKRQLQHLTKALWLPANISFPFGLVCAPANFRICMHTVQHEWCICDCLLLLFPFLFILFLLLSTLIYSHSCVAAQHTMNSSQRHTKAPQGLSKGPLLSSVLLSSQCYLCVKRQNSAQQNTSTVKPLYFTCQSRWVISWPVKVKCGVCSTIIITEEAPLVLC